MCSRDRASLISSTQIPQCSVRTEPILGVWLRSWGLHASPHCVQGLVLAGWPLCPQSLAQGRQRFIMELVPIAQPGAQF